MRSESTYKFYATYRGVAPSSDVEADAPEEAIDLAIGRYAPDAGSHCG